MILTVTKVHNGYLEVEIEEGEGMEFIIVNKGNIGELKVEIEEEGTEFTPEIVK